MIGLDILLLIFIILFGVVGSIRGWAKELLVTFAIILALFIINLLERFVPFIRDNIAASDQTLFWIRTVITAADGGLWLPNAQNSHAGCQQSFCARAFARYPVGPIPGSFQRFLDLWDDLVLPEFC